MTTTCDQLAPLLVSRPLGLLESAQTDRLATHLPGCARCQDFARLVDHALAGARLEPAAPAPVDRDPPGWAALEERIAAAGRGAGLEITLECVYCHDGLTRPLAVYCASCLAPHHADCFRAHGACSTPGCAETQVVRPGRPEPAASARARGPWLTATLLLGAAGLGVAALWPAAGDAIDARPAGAQAPPPPVVPAPGPVETTTPIADPPREDPAGTTPAEEPPGTGGVTRLEPSPVAGFGMVVAVSGAPGPLRVTISLGSDDKVQRSSVYRLLRGEEEIAQAQVDEVRRDSSIAAVLSSAPDRPPQPGDGAGLVPELMVSVECQDQDVRHLVRQLAAAAGLRISLPTRFTGRVSMDLQGVHPLRALQAIVRTCGPYELLEEPDGLLRVEHRDAIPDPRETRVVPIPTGPAREQLRQRLERALAERVDLRDGGQTRLEWDEATGTLTIGGTAAVLRELERLLNAAAAPEGRGH